MATTWQTASFNFSALEFLKPPLEGALEGLRFIEAILQAVLDLIKAFSFDFLNPLKAIIALILAALRVLIDQIRSTGFSVLVVHPDFSNPDASAILNSVSGSYPGFESKVVSKFYDSSDIYRPQYPNNFTVGMIVLYVGAETPGDLLGQIFALLEFIKAKNNVPRLPAPVNVKAGPILQGGDAVSQFRDLFSKQLDKSVQLEWRMPSSPGGLTRFGFAGQAVEFFNSFKYPNFIVERTGPFPLEEGASYRSPSGDIITKSIDSETRRIISQTSAAEVRAPNLNYSIKEEDGSTYRNFPKKIPIQYSGDGAVQAGQPKGANTLGTISLIRGIASGTYRFLDSDPELEEGKTYYYRVRAYFGDAKKYLELTDENSVKDSTLLEVDPIGRGFTFKFAKNKITMSRPSTVVKAVVPVTTSIRGNGSDFNVYRDTFRAIQAGILLGFELPKVYPPESGLENTARRTEQRTGWGTLSVIGGQIGPFKASFPTDRKLRNTVLFNTVARKLANVVAERVYDQPSLRVTLERRWKDRTNTVVDSLVPANKETVLTVPEFALLGIVGGITSRVPNKIEEYLAKEDAYVNGSPYDGPLPTALSTSLPGALSIEDRRKLADFLTVALATVSYRSSYLAWFTVTVGDLFPALLPFLDGFEQFLLGLLKALNSALQEIADIIKTIITKIQALASIIESIIALIDLLSIEISVGVLFVPPKNGNTDTLVEELLESENKPGDSPFGLHSGIVFTFGGPGEGAVAAINALSFVLTFGQESDIISSLTGDDGEDTGSGTASEEENCI